MVFLCREQDIVEDQAIGFELAGLSVFVLRSAGKLMIYENRCPHRGTELNWSPDVFLTRDRSLIMCATHGALFLKHSGLCVGGPCQGQSLRTLNFEITHGEVHVSGPTTNRGG